MLLQAPANHEPSPSAPPPGETLIQHLKQNRRTCLSVWELSRLSLPSTTRLYLQPCCCPGAGGWSRVHSVTAHTGCCLRNCRALPCSGSAVVAPQAWQSCLDLYSQGALFFQHVLGSVTAALGEFEAFHKQKSGDLLQPRLFFLM